LYEEWKMVRPLANYFVNLKMASHNRYSNNYQEENINLVALKLTDKSQKDILELVKNFYPYEYENWIHTVEYIILYNGNIPNNQQDLKGREINCELDGLAKTQFGIYGRIKGLSFVGFSPNMRILTSKEGKDSFDLIKNLNYRNINNIRLSGYIVSFD